MMTIECFSEHSEKSYYGILKIVPEAEGNSRYESKLSFVTLSSFIKLFLNFFNESKLFATLSYKFIFKILIIFQFFYNAMDFFTKAVYCCHLSNFVINIIYIRKIS